MKDKVFLDDKRMPWNGDWEKTKGYADFSRYIEKFYEENNRVPSVISFDHDLDHEHYRNYDEKSYDRVVKTFHKPTGLECAKWLANFCVDRGIQLPEVNVHSHNPVGANKIADLFMAFHLFHYGEDVQIRPVKYNLNNPPKTLN